MPDSCNAQSIVCPSKVRPLINVKSDDGLETVGETASDGPRWHWHSRRHSTKPILQFTQQCVPISQKYLWICFHPGTGISQFRSTGISISLSVPLYENGYGMLAAMCFQARAPTNWTVASSLQICFLRSASSGQILLDGNSTQIAQLINPRGRATG